VCQYSRAPSRTLSIVTTPAAGSETRCTVIDTRSRAPRKPEHSRIARVHRRRQRSIGRYRSRCIVSRPWSPADYYRSRNVAHSMPRSIPHSVMAGFSRIASARGMSVVAARSTTPPRAIASSIIGPLPSATATRRYLFEQSPSGPLVPLGRRVMNGTRTCGACDSMIRARARARIGPTTRDSRANRCTSGRSDPLAGRLSTSGRRRVATV